MRCKRCGKSIKYENGRWHHYYKQNHWAIPLRFQNTTSLSKKIQNILSNKYLVYISIFIFGFLTSSYSNTTASEIKELFSNITNFMILIGAIILIIVLILKIPPRRPQTITMQVNQ